jgi:hypothetical protein
MSFESTSLLILTLGVSNIAFAYNIQEMPDQINPEGETKTIVEFNTQGSRLAKFQETEVDVESQSNSERRRVNTTTPSGLNPKHSGYLTLRLGFPFLAGAGLVYSHSGLIDYNLSINAQTIFLASSYNGSISWNFYKGFFIGGAFHVLDRHMNEDDGPTRREFFGPQIGIQRSWGKNNRWYFDTKAELLTDAEHDAVVPTLHAGFGIRLGLR